MKKLLFFFTLILIYVGSVDAQTKVGVMLNTEVANDYLGVRPGAGLVIDHKVTRKGGIESGLFYRTYRNSISVYVENPGIGRSIFFIEIGESHMTIPILYKFHTRIVNLSFGPTFDFFLGWKQKSGSPDIEVNEYSIDPNFGYGAMLKMSKSIQLSDFVSFEPDLRFNPVFTNGRVFGGVGLAFKYQTKKN
ncbi:hypothetical protein [Algoriphagus marinus]|uniref:hypothetical protein n=1 Tax=Algoriphagus marinus TaxID=1925762 RepID=UPI00094BBE4E|nr:hypothetical protein [Algoriphagus marinus]